eukprot:CAMPEP_0116888188 /NCGR_PEP_ID=MMETSP0463-20121206/23041_1 /TAXON_ID=181622 /ORGANISM="Strombidinopsis sp, Strain SopsisLIS2011" /LENGTH=31 /DNA_ID= /DNA_START= /DNA_END= /DNA_ORIENTATION=
MTPAAINRDAMIFKSMGQKDKDQVSSESQSI